MPLGSSSPNRGAKLINSRRARFVIRSVLALVVFASSIASASDRLMEASNGTSSFIEQLGPDYSVQFPVKNVPGSRLVLFDREAFTELGLSAADLQTLEAKILERFAVTSVGAEGSARTMFATRYLDGYSQELDLTGAVPHGDGRVAWTGELQVPTADGRILYLDFAIKGIPTPLAGKTLYDENGRPKNLQYSDGLQSMEEAVRSFIASQAVHRNGLNSIRDIAVIEIPTEKIDAETGARHRAAITVRMGSQTRLSHVVAYKDDRARLKRVFDYIVTRDLGLKFGTPITEEIVLQFIEKLTRRIAKLHAYYTDLEFVHGSLTLGNVTSKGEPIDFGTFMALDASHGNLQTSYGQTTVGNQGKDLLVYVQSAIALAQKAGYFQRQVGHGIILVHQFKNELREQSNLFLARLRLQRLGLSAREIESLPAELRERFNYVCSYLQFNSGKKAKTTYAGELVPNAFDYRQILADSVRVARLPAHTQESAWVELFSTSRSWGTLSAADLRATQGLALFSRPNQSPYRQTLETYRAAVSDIVRHLESQGADLDRIVSQARATGARRRAESTFPNISHILASIRKGQGSAVENSAQAFALIEGLTDWKRSGSFSHLVTQRSCFALFR